MQTGRTADAGHAADDHAHAGLSSFRSDNQQQQQQHEQQQQQQQQHQRHQYYQKSESHGANGNSTAAKISHGHSLSETSESHHSRSEDGQGEPQSPTAPTTYKAKAHAGESQQQRVSASAYAPNTDAYAALPSSAQASPSHPSPANTFASYAARANHLSGNDDRETGNGNGGSATPGALVGITNAMSGATVSSAHHQVHPDQMSMSQQSGSFMVPSSNTNHNNTVLAPVGDGATASHQHGGSGVHFGSSMPPFPQSAPPSVTAFGMHSSMQSQGTGGMYPPNYYPPPHTSSTPQSFLLQQQQQSQGQGQGHGNAYAPSHAQMAAPEGFPSPYFYAQGGHPMTGYYSMDGKATPPLDQAQQSQVAPPHHYHPYAGAEGRRGHPRTVTPPSMGATSAAGHGHFVPSQGYRGGGGGGGGGNSFHPNAVPPLNAMSIFTANPDNLPDVRFSDQPLNPGSQYGRLPNGKIIELFPAMMRTIQACEYCRSRKAKCTGGLPCERCNKKNIKCEYAQLDKKRKIKTTTSEYDMSSGGPGSASSSSSTSYAGASSARAQAMLSVKVGLAGNKVKHERGHVGGGGGGAGGAGGNMSMDMEHSYSDRPTFASPHTFGVGQWSHDMDADMMQHLPPKFTVPLPTSVNMFEQEGSSSSFGSHDSSSLHDYRKRADPSSPPSAYSGGKAPSPLFDRRRERRSSRLASSTAKDDSEQSFGNALGLYT